MCTGWLIARLVGVFGLIGLLGIRRCPILADGYRRERSCPPRWRFDGPRRIDPRREMKGDTAEEAETGRTELYYD